MGLAGAGAWARKAHAPFLAAGPDTTLAGVWSRRHDRAAELAGEFGAPAFDTFDALLDRCEAVAFAVPPAVQPDLAVRAARAGRPLLLDKPLAADVAGAERLVGAVAETGVASQLVLTLRYAPEVRSFLTQARTVAPFGAAGVWVSGGTRRGEYATPWRQEAGVVMDVGPHLVDLLDAALGPVVGVHAHGRRKGWAGLLLEHDGGAISEASMCSTAEVEAPTIRIEVFGAAGTATVDRGQLGSAIWPTIVAEFATVVRTGEAHVLDARHGLRLQRIVAAADGVLA